MIQCSFCGRTDGTHAEGCFGGWQPENAPPTDDLEWRYEDLRNDLVELQRAMNIELAQLRQENADLCRQLAEVREVLDRISIAAGADDASPAAILAALTE